MDSEAKQYKRLPGRGSRIEGARLITIGRSISTLWLGEDHLLCVDRIGFTENYKRFYYRDIQAVIIRRTSRAWVTNCVLTAFVILFAALGLAVSEPAGRGVLWFIGLIFVPFLIDSLWKGPSCMTHLQTAVQRDELAAWCRMRSARKGFATLREKIIEAQGTFFPEELKRELSGQFGAPPSPSAGAEIGGQPDIGISTQLPNPPPPNS